MYALLEQFGYTDVTIETNNVIESHPTYKITHTLPFSFFYIVPKDVIKTDYSQHHFWNQEKVFGCFYNRPLWHRIGLAATLQYDHADKTLLNVRANPTNTDEQQFFETNELFCNSMDSFYKFSQVVSSWPKQVEPVDRYEKTVFGGGQPGSYGYANSLASYYTNFLIDIVGETWISGKTFFLTEKTVRPMLLKKPMIVMGAAGTLMYLRRMGFKTFWEFWDEDYDGYSEKDRYEKIVNLINNLAKKSPEELSDIYAKMQPILDHNYNLLINQSFKQEFEHE